jgi:hypothetical protein
VQDPPQQQSAKQVYYHQQPSQSQQQVLLMNEAHPQPPLALNATRSLGSVDALGYNAPCHHRSSVFSKIEGGAERSLERKK